MYQFDVADPMNPLGLLMAYAEAQLLPVVRGEGVNEEPESFHVRVSTARGCRDPQELCIRIRRQEA